MGAASQSALTAVSTVPASTARSAGTSFGHHGHVRGRDDVRRLVRVQAEHGLAEQRRWAGLHHADVEVAVLHRPGEVTVLVRRPHPFVLVGRDRSAEDQRLGAAAHAGAEGADQDLPGPGLGDGDGADLAASGAHPEGQLLHRVHPLPAARLRSIVNLETVRFVSLSYPRHGGTVHQVQTNAGDVATRPPRHRRQVRPRGRGRGGRARRRSTLAGRRAGHRRAADRPRRRPPGPRRRAPTSELGARLDQEADALLILVLSAIVAADLGWWVLGIGLARYVLRGPVHAGRPAAVAPGPAAVLVQDGRGAGRDRPRRRGRAPAAGPGGDRRGRGRGGAARRVVPARGGRPLAGSGAPLVGALRHGARVPRGLAGARGPDRPRPPDRDRAAAAAARGAGGGRPRPWCRGGGCGSRSRWRPGCCWACSCWSRCWTSSFNTVFDRDFDPVGDWSYLGPGVGVLGDSIGAGWARVVAVLAGLATLAVLVGVPLAMLRLVKVAAGHRRFSLTAATAFVSAWVLCFATGVQAVSGAPVASTSAASLTVDEVQLVRADLADLREFSREIDTDPYAERAAADPQALLSGLRRQGRAARLRRELRAGGRAGHVVLRGDHAGPRPGHPGARRRPATTRRARSSPRRRSAPAAGWRTPACSPGSGSTASAATGSCSARTG